MSGRNVTVLRSERTGGERGDQLGKGSGNEPRQRVCGHHRRLLRKPPGDQLAPKVGEGRRQDSCGDGDRQEGERVSPEFGAEPSLCLGAGQVGDDHHPEGLSTEHEHEVDPVGGQEAVGPRVPAELVRQEGAGNGGGQAQGHI